MAPINILVSLHFTCVGRHQPTLLIPSPLAEVTFIYLFMLCNIITIPLSVQSYVVVVPDMLTGSGSSSSSSNQQQLVSGNSNGNRLARALTNANLNKQLQQIKQQQQTDSEPEIDYGYPNPNINNAGHNITLILDNLKNDYDKRVRPNYAGLPVFVNINFHIISISSVNEVQMDFTTDFYFRQSWFDPRLRFEPFKVKKIDSTHTNTTSPHNTYETNTIDQLCVGAEFAKQLWLPDTFFANEKSATFHIATTDNTFIRIKSDGEVFRSIRLTVTCSCPMDLQYFPMDRQRCKIEIESYGYSTRDITYRWSKNNASVSLDGNIELPQFKVLGHRLGNETTNITSGVYDRLYCEIHFVRSMGYYLIQIYIPASLIVIISWVSFWLHRNATPARVALGVTTVLTMTTLMSSTNAALPKISYVKSIDVFLGTCFVMVFASLLEYASVGYVGKRISMKSKRQQDLQRLHQHHQKVCVAAAASAAAAQATQTLNQHTPKIGFLSRLGNISNNTNYIFSKGGGILSNTQHQQPKYPTQPAQQLYYDTNQQQHHQHQPPTQTQTLQRRFTTSSANSNAPQYGTSSQPVSVRRLVPDSEPIYGQRSAIKIMIDPRQAQNSIYRQSVINQSRLVDSETSIHSGSDNLNAATQQQHSQPGIITNDKANISNSHLSSTETTAALAAAAAAVTSSSGPTTEFEVTTGPKDMIKICGCTPSSIDKYSRVLFPICFVCFNLMYWIVYGHISGQLDDDKKEGFIVFNKNKA